MLKWTIPARRETQDVKIGSCVPLSSNFQSTESLPHTPRSKTKRRRSSASRRTSTQKRCSLDALEADKENQFHSTPIKNASSGENFSPFRDVSNLTPSDGCKRGVDKASSPKFRIKKKKECLESHDKPRVSDGSIYFKPFEAVDSHIESILAEELCSCKKVVKTKPCGARTPKIFSFGIVNKGVHNVDKAEGCPPTKKAKVSLVDDTASPTSRLKLPEVKLDPQKRNILENEVRVSPLVRKFLDLKFNSTDLDRDAENSSFINDMSLDRLVDVLLENSSRSHKDVSLNSSMVVNVDKDSEQENDHNETKEENMMNSQHERQIELNSEASSDSGFKSSTTENSHQLDNNFLCKCNNNNPNFSRTLPLEKTIIQLNETYNERCVDSESSRKRSSVTPEETDDSKRPKIEDDCTLKRQRCVRKRKAEHLRKKLSRINSSVIESKTVSPFWSTHKKFLSPSDEESFTFPFVENTPLRGCYLENKDILGTPFAQDTPSDSNRTIRKCLVFDSPRVDDSSSFGDSTVRNSAVDVRGSIDLRIFCSGGSICINVIKCQDLYRSEGENINAYVKVAISDRLTSSRRRKNAVLQRTPVQSNSSRPIFNHTFKFARVPADSLKRIHLEVWHRERSTKSSEFLGCMSFDVKDVYCKVIEGSYRLLPQAEGRLGNVALTNDRSETDLQVTDHQVSNMGDNNQDGCGSVTEEIFSLDGVETELKRSTNRAILSEQQKYADEHLFLRYLELDPTEGPEAIPAATQRKATGNRYGRTPFTQTKRLVRPAKSGFGFSVVWTHPPRIERVEKGLPADRAGILPGDYIIFVDKHNVVMMPEIDILNLIRSYGSQLTLELFRRNPSRNGSVPSVHQKSTTIVTPSSVRTDSNVNLPSNTAVTALRRPSTVCSTNTASMDYRRRKLNLPQVTFSSEKPPTNPEECRKRSIYQLIGKEQQYATALQFAITRFVSALAERRDLITPSEHKILFQNCEELLRITEDILDHLVHEDGEMDPNMMARIYRCKLREITTAYKKYCGGIKKADCILANKLKNSNSDFVRFVQCPAIPRRRPDITCFIHKPLTHYREVLKILMTIQSSTPPKHEDCPVINQIVHEMQVTYREITSEGGLMEPCGEGRPLLSVQDLENRLVFTKCKPFVLNKPGRQWIFGGDLSRVEGRNVRQYWTLLFSDLLLFAKASRDRVLFITEDPLPLAHVTDMFFNIRKKDTEFRICVNSDVKNQATSPTVHCGPDLSRTPKRNSTKKTVILRAPTTELKAVWQNLLQRQIFHLNSGMDGSSLSSPMESPEVPITSSVGTLHSVETCSLRRQPENLAHEHLRNNNDTYSDPEVKKQIETLIEHKCKIMGKTGFNGKCNAIHLEQWMKLQLNSEVPESPVVEQIAEEWTEEMLRKRSEELQLIDSKGYVTASADSKRNESRCEEVAISDQEEQSPSKSTTTESQVTVRSSPIVPEAVQVCRQCHKNCLSNVLANNKLNSHAGHFTDLQDCNSNLKNNNQLQVPPSPEKIDNEQKADDPEEDWQSLLLFGLCANPVASLVRMDPFQSTTANLPKEQTEKSIPNGEIKQLIEDKNHCCCSNTPNCKNITIVNNVSSDISPDDSPQTEEHPYHSLSSSALTLRRYGTVSSLERYGSQDRVDGRSEAFENNCSSEESDLEEDDYLGIDNEAFNHSSILSWTARAGSFVAEKMSFFEKLGEDYKSSGGFFDRYLKSPENHINGEEVQEEETSGATSGEEVWGTPTSGGDLDEPLNSPNSPNFEGHLSPNNGSYSSDNLDDTELMMDELLMAPPITGAILRGLLPRRTLEPLIEEDFSESTSSPSSSEPTSPPSGSSEQGNRTGSAADTCSRDVADLDRSEAKATETRRSQSSGSGSAGTTTTTSHEGNARRSPSTPASWEPTTSRSQSDLGEVQRDCVDEKECYEEASDLKTAQPSPSMPRSESYRKIVEAAEDAILEDNGKTSQDVVFFFDHFQPAGKFVNIESVPRSRSIRIFDFFNVRRTERRIYEKYPQNRSIVTMYSKETMVSDSVPIPSTQNNVSPRKLKDNTSGRFWRQLSRRKAIDKPTNPA